MNLIETKEKTERKLLLLVGFSGKQFGINTKNVDKLIDMQDLKWEKELLHETWEPVRYRDRSFKVFFPFGKCCLVSKHLGMEDMFSVVLVRKQRDKPTEICGIVVDGVYGVVKESDIPESFKRFDIGNLF